MKYDLKSSFGKKETTPETLEFQKNYIQYKKIHEVKSMFLIECLICSKESNAARKELLQENERLQAEILLIKTNYEKEVRLKRNKAIKFLKD